MTAATIPVKRKKTVQIATLMRLGVAAAMDALFGCAPSIDRSIEAPNQRVATYLDALVADDREVGLEYMVVDRDGVVFEYTGGRQDVVGQQPVTERTTFMSASSSKVVTAAAVLQLAERGRLDLDAPLSTYLSDLPYGNAVTIRHLLNQSSGLPNPLPLDWLHTRGEHASYDERKALREIIAQNPELDFEPGEKYAYSNLSYWLLGAVVAEVSGSSFCEYLRREVFAPLEIERNELDCEVADWSHQAHGHQNRFSLMGLVLPLITDDDMWAGGAGKWARIEHVYMNGPAYGGLVGNHRGYAKFLQDLLRPRSKLFGDSTRRAFFSPQRDNAGCSLPTTLGWHRTAVDGIVAFSKPGGGPGFNSNVRIYPKLGLASVYLSNQMRVSESEIQAFSDTLDQAFLEARRPR